MAGNSFSDAATRRIRRAVLESEALPANRPDRRRRAGRSPFPFVVGNLTTTIVAGSPTSPTTATLDPLRIDSGGDLVDADASGDDNVTITNYSGIATIQANVLAVAFWLGEKWLLLAVDSVVSGPEYVNNSGATVPAFGFLRITGHNGTRWTAAKSNGLGSFGLAAVNGAADVLNGATGNLSFDFPNWVLYDTADTPAVGQQWGPVNASWEVELDSLGFVIAGGATSGRVLVARSINHTFLGQFDANVNALETGTFSLHKFVGAIWTNTDHDVTARNISGVQIIGGTTGNGDRCAGQYMPNDGQFVVSPLEC